MKAAVMQTSAIKVGERFRKDPGDIVALARSISVVGLLHPIVVRADGTLIAGGRRLEAVKKLGWASIPVTVIDIEQIARGEHAENVERKDFTLSEAVAIARALEPEQKAAAKKRQGTRTDKHPGKLPHGSSGRARDIIAKPPAREHALSRKPARLWKRQRPNLRSSASSRRTWTARATPTARTSVSRLCGRP
jgi:ParB-like chromosome segregation protein Spo0J